MFHEIIFLLLIVSSLSCNFNRCAVCFQSFMNIACRSTQNVVRIKRFLRLHIVIKPLNKKINIKKLFIMLKRNSINVHSNTPHSSHVGLSRLRWAPFEHFLEFGALFCILSTLKHFFALWATFEQYFTFRANFEQHSLLKHFKAKSVCRSQRESCSRS